MRQAAPVTGVGVKVGVGVGVRVGVAVGVGVRVAVEVRVGRSVAVTVGEIVGDAVAETIGAWAHAVNINAQMNPINVTDCLVWSIATRPGSEWVHCT
jgi:hypothetical protein